MKTTQIVLLIIALLMHPSVAQITVATAANMQYAMEDLKNVFTKSTGVKAAAVYGASGNLLAQIKNGAPFDLFVSADVAYPDSAFKWGYAAAKPRIYAYGVLVFWTMKDLDLKEGFSVLSNRAIKKIAVGDPAVTVYGPAAIEALKHAGVYDAVVSKLVFGNNISQVSQYIATQAAEIGFTAKSLVCAGPMADKGHSLDVDTTFYAPIAQAAVILKYGADNNPQASKNFYGFLCTEKARKILQRYGYKLP
ncbi:MAG: molybdate ABC transporter substrate-binding protein [Chitinivibrionales bacterium]|nr:molybdate ABC transporter substrate-binding protein [Chitinivibrionales bacterium]